MDEEERRFLEHKEHLKKIMTNPIISNLKTELKKLDLDDFFEIEDMMMLPDLYEIPKIPEDKANQIKQLIEHESSKRVLCCDMTKAEINKSFEKYAESENLHPWRLKGEVLHMAKEAYTGGLCSLEKESDFEHYFEDTNLHGLGRPSHPLYNQHEKLIQILENAFDAGNARCKERKGIIAYKTKGGPSHGKYNE